MKKEICGFALIAILLAVLGFRYHQLREQRSSFLSAMDQLAKTVRAGASSHDVPLADSQLPAGSADRARLFGVRRAYDHIQWDSHVSADTLAELTTVARGLNDVNQVVRQTSEDIARHMLTQWVRSRPPEQWHKSGEIDAFFRVFKNTNSRSLNRFLKVMGDGPESRYLTEIKEET